MTGDRLIFFTIAILSVSSTKFLNVSLVSSDTALLQWLRTGNESENVEIVFKIVGDRYYTVLPVIVAGDNENEINQIMIDNLSPFSRYQIFIRPIKKCDHSILSEKVFFTTSVLPQTSGTKLTDLGILCILFVLWCLVLIVFLKRWGKIRDLIPYQPYQPPYIKRISDKLERIQSEKSNRNGSKMLNVEHCSKCLHKDSIVSRLRQDTETSSSLFADLVLDYKHQVRKTKSVEIPKINVHSNISKEFSRQYSNSDQTLAKNQRQTEDMF